MMNLDRHYSGYSKAKIISASITVLVVLVGTALMIALVIIYKETEKPQETIENDIFTNIVYKTVEENVTQTKKIELIFHKENVFWFYNITKVMEDCQNNGTNLWIPSDDENEWIAVQDYLRIHHLNSNESRVWLNGKLDENYYNTSDSNPETLIGNGFKLDWFNSNQSSHFELTFKHRNDCIFFEPFDTENWKIVDCSKDVFYRVCTKETLSPLALKN